MKLETAMELTHGSLEVLESEIVEVKESIGRCLTENLYSKMDQPPFPTSPLDGYAFSAADSIGASCSNPVVLKVIGTIHAGDSFVKTIKAKEAVKVMTGGQIPKGCDCVIMQEMTDYGEDRVNIYKEMSPYENYCQVGENFSIGELLIEAGTRIYANEIMALSMTGINKVKVNKKAKVAILATGNEIVEPGDALDEGDVYNSNGHYLEAKIQEMGAEVVDNIPSFTVQEAKYP